jgi:MFS transporter, DHA2 family, glioxin efflux transporter
LLTGLPVFLTIGGAFLLSAAQSAFNNELIRSLSRSLPSIDPKVALGVGAGEIREAFAGEDVPFVVAAYVQGLQAVFAFLITTYGVAFMIGFFGSWKRLGQKELKEATAGAA